MKNIKPKAWKTLYCWTASFGQNYLNKVGTKTSSRDHTLKRTQYLAHKTDRCYCGDKGEQILKRYINKPIIRSDEWGMQVLFHTFDGSLTKEDVAEIITKDMAKRLGVKL